jgi:hypothetical protein
MELVVVVAAFTLLATGLVIAIEAWTRQQQLKLMRASNTRLLKR